VLDEIEGIGPERCSAGITVSLSRCSMWPGARPGLDEIEGIGPERCSAGITAAVVELAQVPELGRALGALDDGQGLAQVLDDHRGRGAARWRVARPGARRSPRPWRCSVACPWRCSPMTAAVSLALLGGLAQGRALDAGAAVEIVGSVARVEGIEHARRAHGAMPQVSGRWELRSL
jgi:hypothetical protein